MLAETTGRKNGGHLYRNILKTMELLLENIKITKFYTPILPPLEIVY
jgi:predicted DNA-binding protein with PD1-like motif